MYVFLLSLVLMDWKELLCIGLKSTFMKTFKWNIEEGEEHHLCWMWLHGQSKMLLYSPALPPYTRISFLLFWEMSQPLRFYFYQALSLQTRAQDAVWNADLFSFSKWRIAEKLCLFWLYDGSGVHTTYQSPDHRGHGVRWRRHEHHRRWSEPSGSRLLGGAHGEILPGLGDAAGEKGPTGRPAAETTRSAGCKQHLLWHIRADFI